MGGIVRYLQARNKKRMVGLEGTDGTGKYLQETRRNKMYKSSIWLGQEGKNGGRKGEIRIMIFACMPASISTVLVQCNSKIQGSFLELDHQ
jgi:hypothetical protein